MGYKFTIKGGVRVKKDGRYPWPCAGEPARTIELDPTDVLTKNPDGTYTVHTGLCCFGIVLTDDEVEPIGKDSHLKML